MPTPCVDLRCNAKHPKHIMPQGIRMARDSVLMALIAAIGLGIMMNGAVVAPYQQIAVYALLPPLALTLAIRIHHPATARLIGWCAIVAGGLLIWAIAQSIELPSGVLAHPVWDDLSELGIDAPLSISVSPSSTWSAIPQLILPLCIFAAMLLLCQNLRSALLAWKVLAALGLAIFALSAVLELFFPNVTFFSRFEVGRGAFNGVFVNRNTTAAFLALTAFATTGWLFLPRDGTTRHSGISHINWQSVFLCALLFLLLIALLSTRSRAGATFALICLTLAIASIFALKPEKSGYEHYRRSNRIKAGLVLGAGATLFITFGETLISRMGAIFEDGRICVWRATWEIITERPFTGMGLGTFADVFPQFRNAECLGTQGVWLRAHNSYLEFLAGMGVIGGVLGMIALTVLVRSFLIGLRQRRSLQAIPILSLGALAFILLHSSVDFPLQIPGLAYYFAALTGAGCAISILPSARPAGT